MNLIKIIKATLSLCTLCLAMLPEERMLQVPAQDTGLCEYLTRVCTIPNSLTIVFLNLLGNDLEVSVTGMEAVRRLATLKQAERVDAANFPMSKEAANMLYDILRDPSQPNYQDLVRLIIDETGILPANILPLNRVSFLMTPSPNLRESWNETLRICVIKNKEPILNNNSAGDPVSDVAFRAHAACLCASPVLFCLSGACVYTQLTSSLVNCCAISCVQSICTVSLSDCIYKIATRVCLAGSLFDFGDVESLWARPTFPRPLPGFTKRLCCCCLVR